jgi:hypothetical protein
MRLVKMLLIAGLVAALQTTPAPAAHTQSGPDVVLAWNDVTMSTLVAAGTPGAEQVLHLAYVHRAVYDGALRARDLRPHASIPAAVTAAAYRVLATNFPAQRADLDRAYADALATLPDGPSRNAGLTVGRAAAEALLADRAGDGRNGPVGPAPAPGPGVWTPVPPDTAGVSPWLATVRPFALRSPSQFRPSAPPSLRSTRWAVDYNETRLLGSATSTLRTAGQTEVARFWSDPTFVQNQRALRAHARKTARDVVETARLFALADTAAADALIACWDAKYHYTFWRPAGAIPAGDTDRHPATPADPGWVPLLSTPNHPEYPSAHSCVTNAIATVLAALARHGRFDFDVDSTATGTRRHFTSASQLRRELSDARVWGGLHWRFSTAAGAEIGRSVGRVVMRVDRGGH